MADFEFIQTIIQGIVAVGIFATLWIYYHQFRIMEEQLQVMNGQLQSGTKASVAQNLLTIINFLQAEYVRDARTTVITRLDKIRFEDWNENLKYQAGVVCSTYDVTAIIIKQGLIPKEPIIDNWGRSILKSHSILQPYITEMQKPDQGGSKYWSNFEWLAEEVKKRNI